MESGLTPAMAGGSHWILGVEPGPGPGQGWAEFSDRVRVEVSLGLSLRLCSRLDCDASSGCGRVSLGSQQIFFDESHWEQLCYPGLTHSKQQSVELLSTEACWGHFGGVLLVLEVS